jgi:hypothetical protein
MANYWVAFYCTFGFQIIFHHLKTKIMTPDQNSANQQNANTGTPGTNTQYDQAQGNRGKQLNPNQGGKGGGKSGGKSGGSKGGGKR